MPAEITMPQLSDTMAEGTLTKWLKKEGDAVKAGEVIAEVETDKANMEMEAFEAGTLAVIVAKEGDKVAVGAAIGVLATDKENPADVKKAYGSVSSAPTPVVLPAAGKAIVAPVPNIPATATLEEASNSEVRDPDDNLHGATRQVIPDRIDEPHDDNGSDRVRISPLAKRIAQDQGLELSQLQGTGPSGRIIQRDVLAVIESKPAVLPTTKPASGFVPNANAQPPARLGSGEKQVIPLSKMRQTIATRLQQAKQTIPHIYLSVDIDMENVNTLRERANATLEKQKIRLSIADFVAKAVATALAQHPALNAHFDAKANEITRFGDVHLGFAVALPDGLIVPVLRNVHLMGLKELRLRSADLFDRAKEQKLKREELSGATFTISSLGVWGIKEFSAIINPPEVAILAVSAAEKRAVVKDNQIVARTMMTVTLSTDHRAIDGATAADFLKTFKGLLEEPGMMLV